MKQIFIQTAAADLLGKAAQYKKTGTAWCRSCAPGFRKATN